LAEAVVDAALAGDIEVDGVRRIEAIYPVDVSQHLAVQLAAAGRILHACPPGPPPRRLMIGYGLK
jgi:hypothetical protein